MGGETGNLSMVSEFLELKRLMFNFYKRCILKDNEIEWGMWWEGKFALSHGTYNSARVAMLFSANMIVNILNVENIVEGQLLLTQIE